MTALPLTAECFRVPYGPASVAFADIAPDPSLPDTHRCAVPEAVVTTPVPEDVRRTALMFARAIVEGLSGRRSVAQFGDLVAQRVLVLMTARARADRHRSPLSPASIRVQLVSPHAAEVTLRLVREGRSTAAAFRLERRRGRWRCTALVVGP